MKISKLYETMIKCRIQKDKVIQLNLNLNMHARMHNYQPIYQIKSIVLLHKTTFIIFYKQYALSTLFHQYFSFFLHCVFLIPINSAGIFHKFSKAHATSLFSVNPTRRSVFALFIIASYEK